MRGTTGKSIQLIPAPAPSGYGYDSPAAPAPSNYGYDSPAAPAPATYGYGSPQKPDSGYYYYYYPVGSTTTTTTTTTSTTTTENKFKEYIGLWAFALFIAIFFVPAALQVLGLIPLLDDIFGKKRSEFRLCQCVREMKLLPLRVAMYQSMFDIQGFRVK